MGGNTSREVIVDPERVDRLIVVLCNSGKADEHAAAAVELQTLVEKSSSALGMIMSEIGESRYISPKTVPMLIKALGDKDYDVRSSAAEALGKIGAVTPEVVPALIKALGDKDQEVRRSAAEALGKIGPVTPEVVPALINALGDKDYYVRSRAAEALGEIGRDARDAVPTLMGMLQNYSNGLSQIAAIAVAKIDLKRFKDVEEQIREAAKSDNETRRKEAQDLIESYAKQESEAAAPALIHEKMLFNMIERGWADGVERQLELLEKEMGDEELRKMISTKVNSDGWSMLHIACMSKNDKLIKVLGKYGDPGLEGPYGVTPLHIAAMVSSKAIDKLGKKPWMGRISLLLTQAVSLNIHRFILQY